MKRKDILQAQKALTNADGAYRRNPLSPGIWIGTRTALLAVLFAASCLAQFDGGGGPSILSRGGARPGQSGGKPITFNFYAGIGASYSTGSLPIDVGDGNIQSVDLVGGSVNAGLTGSHVWKRSALGLDYRGNYRRYNRRSLAYADGSEQAIDLQYNNQITRRVMLNITVVGGTSNIANGGFVTPTTILDPSLIGVPTNNIFDSRLYYVQTSVGVVYRKNSRLSFSFTGDGFTVKRAAKGLVGVQGYRAGAQAIYQMSRRDQVAIGYNFTHFEYPRAFGASDLHGVNLSYSRRLAPGLQFNAGAGLYRVETLGAEQITLRPEIAEILGQSTGYQAVYRINYVPQYTAGITYGRGRSTFNAGATAGVTPGNGVYLTSRAESIGGGYSYSGFRKVSFSLNATASQYSSVFQTLEKFRAYNAGFTVGYTLTRHLSASFQVDARSFNVGGRNRFGEFVSIGLFWSPTEIPIPSW
jgi:hypothetical protein